MKRRPFFLLEVLIAVILVSGFAYMTIQGAFQVIYKQKKMLAEIETAMKRDLDIMDAIKDSWNDIGSLVNSTKQTKSGFYVSCQEGKKDKQYLLAFREKDKEKPFFCYFVSK